LHTKPNIHIVYELMAGAGASVTQSPTFSLMPAESVHDGGHFSPSKPSKINKTIFYIKAVCFQAIVENKLSWSRFVGIFLAADSRAVRGPRSGTAAPFPALKRAPAGVPPQPLGWVRADRLEGGEWSVHGEGRSASAVQDVASCNAPREDVHEDRGAPQNRDGRATRGCHAEE